MGVTVPLTAFKMLTGRMLEDGEFSFELVDADGTVPADGLERRARQRRIPRPLRYTAEDLADAAWVDRDGVISRAREFAYAVRARSFPRMP